MDEPFDSWSAMAVLLTLPMMAGLIGLAVKSPAFRWWFQVGLMAVWSGFTIVAPIAFGIYRASIGRWGLAAATIILLAPLGYITAVVCAFWAKRLWTLRADAITFWEHHA